MKISLNLILAVTIYALPAWGAESRNEYFLCPGTTGTGYYQGAPSYKESVTLRAQTQNFTIDSSGHFSGSYDVCYESDTMVQLTTPGDKSFCGLGPAEAKGAIRLGYFNKVSGKLELYAGGPFSGEYKCKKEKKKL